MIYRNSTLTGLAKDLAFAIARGSLDMDVITNSDNALAVVVNDSKRISTYPDTDRQIFGKSDSDTQVFQEFEEKTERGQLFVSIVAAGTYTLDQAMNEVRKICDGVSAFTFNLYNSSTDYQCVYGIQKFTQTIDFIPLDQLAAAFTSEYAQLNLQKVA